MREQNEKGVNGMLISFKFANYRSFRYETEFSMVAASIREHADTVISVNEVNILPISGIYGANASGKSSFFKAFKCMRDVVENDKGDKIDNKFINDSNYTVPYYFVGNPEEEYAETIPSMFEVVLGINGYSYRYGFKCTKKKLLSEWLYKQKISKNKTVERLIYKLDFNSVNIEIGKVNREQTEEILYCNSMRSNNNLLITDLGKRDRLGEFGDILTWFGCSTIVTPEEMNLSAYGENFICSIIKDNSPLFCLRKETPKEEFLYATHEIDPSISDIDVERMAENQEGYKYRLKAIHEIEGTKYEIPFNLESDGTRKNLCLTFFILGILNTGSTLFVDEIDSKLHPLVLRKILRMFDDKNINKKGAQLIFSAHNIINLDSSDLRRDEVWFVEKNNHCSSMYSLYDFSDDDKIRNDLDFGKHYLSGRFGAIPFQD